MIECSMCALVQCTIRAFWFIANSAYENPLIFVMSVAFAYFLMNIFGAMNNVCSDDRSENSMTCNASLTRIIEQIGDYTMCNAFPRYPSNSLASMSYDYSAERGPHTWEYTGTNQSPINILDEYVRKAPIREMLIWNHYDDLPQGVLLENTGHTVVVRAAYSGNTPTVSGGDLLASYSFTELCFRWSGIDNEGSEHMINYRKFPMEMQVMHRTGPITETTSSYDLLFVAYFFEIAAHNPYLDPIVQNLQRIRKAGAKAEIPIFPLSYLCYPFRSAFYSYAGSLTEPPCYQGAEWFIFPEPMSMSEQQFYEFRELLSFNGTKISRNSRPVQPMTERRIVNYNVYNPIEFTRTPVSVGHIETTEDTDGELN